MKLDLQFIKHPNGKERLVVLPESHFHLLERAARACLKRGETEPFLLPKLLLDKIAGGENPVRAVRLWRGLNGRQLSTLAGITPSMLSQIERTGKTGSPRTFKAIGNVLGVPLDLIFPHLPDNK
ncbi:helix-turn-helix domain-containing protein [Mesorhizobium sp. Root695]|uniref:helix-turn-helix domain-containing protein n=1 Tax=Mesorhizobium sp. Root695 TaxID=1736589 RepID=UPI00138F2C11|nr:helix-turn-helix transcriptional regulator [Mesorhizobium sp. Root695]